MWKGRKLLGRDFARRWNHRRGYAGVGHPRPRVLIEEPDAAEAYAYWRLLTDHGYQVSWCPGPTGPPARQCPLVALGHCDLVQCADVVVSSLPLHRGSSRDVIAALRHLHPETPMIVQAPQPLFARWEPLFEGGSWNMRAPVTSDLLLDSVELALVESGRHSQGGDDVPGRD